MVDIEVEIIRVWTLEIISGILQCALHFKHTGWKWSQVTNYFVMKLNIGPPPIWWLHLPLTPSGRGDVCGVLPDKILVMRIISRTLHTSHPPRLTNHPPHITTIAFWPLMVPSDHVTWRLASDWSTLPISAYIAYHRASVIINYATSPQTEIFITLHSPASLIRI